jgi:hypothetical protein
MASSHLVHIYARHAVLAAQAKRTPDEEKEFTKLSAIVENDKKAAPPVEEPPPAEAAPPAEDKEDTDRWSYESPAVAVTRKGKR